MTPKTTTNTLQWQHFQHQQQPTTTTVHEIRKNLLVAKRVNLDFKLDYPKKHPFTLLYSKF